MLKKQDSAADKFWAAVLKRLCSYGLSTSLDAKPVAPGYRARLPDNPTVNRLCTSQRRGAHYLTITLVPTWPRPHDHPGWWGQGEGEQTLARGDTETEEM